MKLIYGITAFSLISTVSLYLVSNLLGGVLIRGQRLFQSKGNISDRISKFLFLSLSTMKMKHKISKRKKKEEKNIQISTIVSLFKCFDNHTI